MLILDVKQLIRPVQVLNIKTEETVSIVQVNAQPVPDKVVSHVQTQTLFENLTLQVSLNVLPHVETDLSYQTEYAFHANQDVKHADLRVEPLVD